LAAHERLARPQLTVRGKHQYPHRNSRTASARKLFWIALKATARGKKHCHAKLAESRDGAASTAVCPLEEQKYYAVQTGTSRRRIACDQVHAIVVEELGGAQIHNVIHI